MKQYFEIKSPHFRHAAFRALDKSLITIEVYGTQQDVQALKNWLPEVTDLAVKDRIAFTLAELKLKWWATKRRYPPYIYSFIILKNLCFITYN